MTAVLGGARDAAMSRVDAPERALRSRCRAEDGVERGVGGPVEAAERVASEVGVLIDAGGDERMRHLEQYGGGAAQRDEELAVQAARDRIAR
jgi:hypothetical protein